MRGPSVRMIHPFAHTQRNQVTQTARHALLLSLLFAHRGHVDLLQVAISHHQLALFALDYVSAARTLINARAEQVEAVTALLDVNIRLLLTPFSFLALTGKRPLSILTRQPVAQNTPRVIEYDSRSRFCPERAEYHLEIPGKRLSWA